MLNNRHKAQTRENRNCVEMVTQWLQARLPIDGYVKLLTSSNGSRKNTLGKCLCVCSVASLFFSKCNILQPQNHNYASRLILTMYLIRIFLIGSYVLRMFIAKMRELVVFYYDRISTKLKMTWFVDILFICIASVACRWKFNS